VIVVRATTSSQCFVVSVCLRLIVRYVTRWLKSVIYLLTTNLMLWRLFIAWKHSSHASLSTLPEVFDCNRTGNTFLQGSCRYLTLPTVLAFDESFSAYILFTSLLIGWTWHHPQNWIYCSATSGGLSRGHRQYALTVCWSLDVLFVSMIVNWQTHWLQYFTPLQEAK